MEFFVYTGLHQLQTTYSIISCTCSVECALEWDCAVCSVAGTLDHWKLGVKTLSSSPPPKKPKPSYSSLGPRNWNTWLYLALKPGVLQSKHSQTANLEWQSEDGKAIVSLLCQRLWPVFSQQPAISLRPCDLWLESEPCVLEVFGKSRRPFRTHALSLLIIATTHTYTHTQSAEV